jgi:CxxC-x17-CxxC domain-containing protein
MDLQDKTLTCRDCGNGFIFTAGEQGFYIEKGLMNEPQRCTNCRANRRRERSGGGTREGATITCAGCGQEAQVPFVPRLDRPVYCNDCFASQREKTTAAV